MAAGENAKGEAAARRDGAAEQARRQIERWFSARGVPQLISGYSSEQRIDDRAVPLVGLWLVVGTVLVWLRYHPLEEPGRTLADNVQAILVALPVTAILVAIYLRVRKHPPFGTRVDLLDIATVAVIPGLVTAAITRSAGIAIGVIPFMLMGVGGVYAVVALGVPELTRWGVRHLRDSAPHIATLVARTLPLLLILVVFLLFAAELWQTARALGVGDLVAVVILLGVVGCLLVVTVAAKEIRDLEERTVRGELDPLVADTPVADVSRDPVALAASWRPLARLERLNLIVLMLVNQLVQSVFVAVVVGVFLVLLGMIVVPAAIQDAWASAPVRALAEFGFLGEPRTLSVELLIAAAILSAVCALYFTGLALTEPTYRAEFNPRVIVDMERIMAVRSVYLALLPPEDSSLEVSAAPGSDR